MTLEIVDRENWDTDSCIGPFEDNYDYLSNFYEAEFVMGQTTYPTAEHAYQAAKARNQPEIFEEIVNADTPTKAKHKGKKPDLPSNWNDKKDKVMLEIVTAKFSQNPELRQKLIETAGINLVEINSWGDTYWGAKKSDGSGRNTLGVILMQVRETFINL